MQHKKTVIVGASTDPGRVSYIAASMLKNYNIPFVPIGVKKGEVFGEEILDLKGRPAIDEVDTITLYLGSGKQKEWYEYLISLEPRRIIFNPGTENEEFMQMADQKDIEVVPACTLVMLRTGQF